ncbi:MAG: dienelactone hydrolase family protein [Proteobacteria bacterium]|nr:dienelactone hydrolase family protein [Pseudomonadota bacterium]
MTGFLHRPQGAGPFPAVVLLHGCGGLFDRSGRLTSRHQDWTSRFHDSGYVVLLVDSFTPRGVADICTRRDRSGLTTDVRAYDAAGALAYLQSRPDVRGDRVGLMGWSHGGGTVLYATAAGAMAPTPDFRAAVAFYPGCRLPNDRGFVPRLPLAILNGEADDWTPAPPCIAFVEQAKAKGSPLDITVYPRAYHDFDAPNQPLRARSGLATVASGTAHAGTDPAARADAIIRVPAFFARYLKD